MVTCYHHPKYSIITPTACEMAKKGIKRGAQPRGDSRAFSTPSSTPKPLPTQSSAVQSPSTFTRSGRASKPSEKKREGDAEEQGQAGLDALVAAAASAASEAHLHTTITPFGDHDTNRGDVSAGGSGNSGKGEDDDDLIEDDDDWRDDDDDDYDDDDEENNGSSGGAESEKKKGGKLPEKMVYRKHAFYLLLKTGRFLHFLPSS